MPTYEYECRRCKKIFEAFQSITEPALKECKYCGGMVDRLIGAGGGIIFKGSGFYATDYRKGREKEDRAAEKKDLPASCPAAKPGGSCQDCPQGQSKE